MTQEVLELLGSTPVILSVSEGSPGQEHSDPATRLSSRAESRDLFSDPNVIPSEACAPAGAMQASNRPQGGSWRVAKNPPVSSGQGDPSTPLRSAQDDRDGLFLSEAEDPPVILRAQPEESPGQKHSGQGDPSTPLRSAQDDSRNDPLAAEPSEAGLTRKRKKEEADGEFSPQGGNGPERVSSDADLRSHYASLCAQAEALRREQPDFDLDAALRDPAFLRLTAPALGVGVREAWYALHRGELEARAAAETRSLLARAVSGGQRRPREGGGLESAALTRSDYRSLSREARERLKQDILEASARGEKLYP